MEGYSAKCFVNEEEGEVTNMNFMAISLIKGQGTVEQEEHFRPEK